MDWHAFKLEARLDGGHWHHASPRPGVSIGLLWSGDPLGWLLSVECRIGQDAMQAGAMAVSELWETGREWFPGVLHCDRQTRWVSGQVRTVVTDGSGNRPAQDEFANAVLAAFEERGAALRT